MGAVQQQPELQQAYPVQVGSIDTQFAELLHLEEAVKFRPFISMTRRRATMTVSMALLSSAYQIKHCAL